MDITCILSCHHDNLKGPIAELGIPQYSHSDCSSVITRSSFIPMQPFWVHSKMIAVLLHVVASYPCSLSGNDYMLPNKSFGDNLCS